MDEEIERLTIGVRADTAERCIRSPLRSVSRQAVAMLPTFSPGAPP